MKKYIGAILLHCTKFDKDDEKDANERKEYRHRFCPQVSASWCKFKKLEHSGSDKSGYNYSINIPEFIHDTIKPIFVKLSSDEFLRKCQHGQTQNGNEALNNMIGTKCPKAIFVDRLLLEMSVNPAILEDNEGSTGVFKVFDISNISPLICSVRISRKRDRISVVCMFRKSSEKVTTRRKHIRKVKEGYTLIMKRIMRKVNLMWLVDFDILFHRISVIFRYPFYRKTGHFCQICPRTSVVPQ